MSSRPQKPIPPDAVRRIIAQTGAPDGPSGRPGEAAWLSASGNRQPWHFIAVGDRDTLRQLGGVARSGPYIAGAPFAVVVCIEETDFAVSDASRAVQSMVVTAWSESIGSNWAGFGGLEGAKPILGIPNNLGVLAIVPFGYPARPGGKGKKQRKPFAQVVSRNRFGQPFE